MRAMKHHNFVIDDERGSPHFNDVCDGCGLTWTEVDDQMFTEDPIHHKTTNDLEDDDCDVRRRKQEMKAFW